MDVSNFRSGDVKKLLSDLGQPSLDKTKSVLETLLIISSENKDAVSEFLDNRAVEILVKLFNHEKGKPFKGPIANILVSFSLDQCGDESCFSDIAINALSNIYSANADLFLQCVTGIREIATSSPLNREMTETAGASDASKPSTSPLLPATHFLTVSSSALLLEKTAALLSSPSLRDVGKFEVLDTLLQLVETGALNEAAEFVQWKGEGESGRKSINGSGGGERNEKGDVPEGLIDPAVRFTKAFDAFANSLKEISLNKRRTAFGYAIERAYLSIQENKFFPTPFSLDSLIIGGSNELNENLAIINKWLFRKYVLLYKATKDGFSASAFHGKCDNKGATVTLITSSEGYLFGGYAAVAWGSGNGVSNIADSSKLSFLFSLKNPRSAAPTRFILSGNAIRYDCNYGPIFGEGWDILCYNNSNSNNDSYTNIGRGYANTTGLDGQKVFTGQRNFTAKDIEVYLVL